MGIPSFVPPALYLLMFDESRFLIRKFETGVPRVSTPSYTTKLLRYLTLCRSQTIKISPRLFRTPDTDKADHNVIRTLFALGTDFLRYTRGERSAARWDCLMSSPRVAVMPQISVQVPHFYDLYGCCAATANINEDFTQYFIYLLATYSLSDGSLETAF